jgi:hypothetical protein
MTQTIEEHLGLTPEEAEELDELLVETYKPLCFEDLSEAEIQGYEEEYRRYQSSLTAIKGIYAHFN